MNSRWASRIVGLFMLLVFVWLMMNLQKQLIEIQRNRQANAPAPTATR